jgi:hypothetical protein
MNKSRKRWLVEHSRGCTLEGSPTSVTGWRNWEATLAPDFGGFWRASWETVDRVLTTTRNFKASDVRLHSRQWLGFGDEIPEQIAGMLT